MDEVCLLDSPSLDTVAHVDLLDQSCTRAGKGTESIAVAVRVEGPDVRSTASSRLSNHLHLVVWTVHTAEKNEAGKSFRSLIDAANASKYEMAVADA